MGLAGGAEEVYLASGDSEVVVVLSGATSELLDSAEVVIWAVSDDGTEMVAVALEDSAVVETEADACVVSEDLVRDASFVTEGAEAINLH